MHKGDDIDRMSPLQSIISQISDNRRQLATTSMFKECHTVCKIWKYRSLAQRDFSHINGVKNNHDSSTKMLVSRIPHPNSAHNSFSLQTP